MIYLDGQIGAVYMNGRYHSEVYLGSVLVWQNVKKIPGEVHAQLAFENTADGVAVVLVPGDAAETLSLSASVPAEAHGMTDGSTGELLTLLTVAESTAAETPNGEALENLLLQYTALGKDIIVNKRQIEEQLKLTTTVPLAVALGLVPAGKAGHGLTMETTIPPAVALVLLPIEAGDALTLTTPVPPGVAATLVDDKASLALQLVQTASAGDAVLFADGLLDGIEQITTLAEGEAGDGAEGAAASELTVGSVIQSEALTLAETMTAAKLTINSTAKWTRGAVGQAAEAGNLTSKAVGYSQIENTVLVGIQGDEKLVLSTSANGAALVCTPASAELEMQIDAECAAQAVTPAPTGKTYIQKWIDGSLEKIEPDDLQPTFTNFGDVPKIQRLPNLVSIEFPKTVPFSSSYPRGLQLYESSFIYLPSLNYIKFSEAIREVYLNCFYDGTYADSWSGADITLDFSYALHIPTTNSEVTTGWSRVKKIIVPASLLDSWKASSSWSAYASIIEAAEE